MLLNNLREGIVHITLIIGDKSGAIWVTKNGWKVNEGFPDEKKKMSKSTEIRCCKMRKGSVTVEKPPFFIEKTAFGKRKEELVKKAR